MEASKPVAMETKIENHFSSHTLNERTNRSVIINVNTKNGLTLMNMEQIVLTILFFFISC